MGYLIRIFSKKNKIISEKDIVSILSGLGCRAFDVEEEKTGVQSFFVIRKDDKEQLLIMKLFPAEIDGDRKKIERIVKNLDGKKPAKAVSWVKKYLKYVKIVYEFIPILDYDGSYNWEVFSELFVELKVLSGGIVQIKNEGFTNESGDIIVWDYPDLAEGVRNMAVMSITGIWKSFEMNLASVSDRKFFFAGKVPPRLKIRR